MTTLLAVSPHLDDAVFSVGASMCLAVRSGWRVVIATVFTATVARPTGFALECQLDKGLPADADYMALRRAEDEAACEIIGATHMHIPFPEAPHRGYACRQALFSGVFPFDRVGLALNRELDDLLMQVQPDIVLAPSAIGRHVDHQLVRDALRALGWRSTLWWEDWPYADRQKEPLRAAAFAIPLSPKLRDLKTRACAAYRTQVPFQFGSELELEQRIAVQDFEWLHEEPVELRSNCCGDCNDLRWRQP